MIDDDRFPYDLSDGEIHPEPFFADNHAALEAETDIDTVPSMSVL